MGTLLQIINSCNRKFSGYFSKRSSQYVSDHLLSAFSIRMTVTSENYGDILNFANVTAAYSNSIQFLVSVMKSKPQNSFLRRIFFKKTLSKDSLKRLFQTY